MKKFISNNWYKLMIGSSLVMASFAFMISAVTSATAKNLNASKDNFNSRSIPLNPDGTITVKFSDEQLSKILPKNADGSINVKLSQDQLNQLSPEPIQSVNIAAVNGHTAGCYKAYTIGETDFYALATDVINPW